MRTKKSEMPATRKNIVESARKLFTETGFEKTSIRSVMEDAGKTHGAFYRHFDSKDDLLAAALQVDLDAISRDKLLSSFQGNIEHFGTDGWLLAVLGFEIGAQSMVSRKAFASILDATVSEVRASMHTDLPAQEIPLGIVLLLVGAFHLSRATAGTDMHGQVEDALKTCIGMLTNSD